MKGQTAVTFAGCQFACDLRGDGPPVGIPGASYIEIKDAAHGVPIEHPEAINKLLLEHLAGAEARDQAKLNSGQFN